LIGFVELGLASTQLPAAKGLFPAARALPAARVDADEALHMRVHRKNNNAIEVACVLFKHNSPRHETIL